MYLLTYFMICLGETEADTEKRKQLRSLIREAMLSKGLDKLRSCNGLTAIPFLQVSVTGAGKTGVLTGGN